MAIRILRTFNRTALFRIVATYSLNDRLYGVELVFNSRAQKWSLNLRSESGEALIQSIRVTPGIDLIEPFHSDERFPPGAMTCVDLGTGGLGVDPGPKSFVDGSHRIEYDDGS